MGNASVAIIGATGYGGAELVRLLSAHPLAKVNIVTSSRTAGKRLSEECPWLPSDLILEAPRLCDLEADVVFLCQETGFAMEHLSEIPLGCKVIDLSADYRLTDKLAYEDFYKRSHSDPGTKAVYGLPELVDRNDIKRARLVANPGCYPTASLLALMPLARAGLIKSTPIVDAKSGVSGAGRSRKETEYLFTEVDNNFRAYGVLSHRHTPEIEQMIGRKVRFTPHLAPMPRGIHATAYVPVESEADVYDLFHEFYKEEKFVKVLRSEPSTKQVLGSNTCAIAPFYDSRSDMVVVCSVIDNLVKGAAGQAIQNMNLMMGIEEGTGLPEMGFWP